MSNPDNPAQNKSLTFGLSYLPIITLIVGVILTLVVSDHLKKEALRNWEENATKVSQWLSGTVLGWMEESYAPVSAISMLQDSHIELTQDDFLIAYDSLESRASAFFLDAIGIFKYEHSRWILKNTTDPFSPLEKNLIISTDKNAPIPNTIDAAEARPGRIVIGQRFLGPTDDFKSSVVLVTNTRHGTYATIGLLNYNALIDGLFDVHSPDGIGLKLSGRFPNRTSRMEETEIAGYSVKNKLFSTSTRTIIGETELIIEWSFNDRFEGGPNTEVSEITLILGMLISILLSMIQAFMARQNNIVKNKVIQATSDLRKTTSLLKEKEERVSFALKGGNLGFWDVTLDSGKTIFNKRYAEIFGYDQNRRDGTREEWINNLHPEDRDIVLKHGQAFRLGLETEYEAEFRIIRTDGEVRWVISKGGGVDYNDDGTIKRMVGTLQDISARKEAEQRITLSEERARLLLHSVGEGVFGVDVEGIITFVNPECKAQLGYEEEELIGTAAHSLFHHSHPDGSHYPIHDCWMYKSFTLGKSYRIDDEVLWRKDGIAIPVEYNSTPIVREDEIVGAVVSFNDISERLVAQKERDEALEVISGSIEYSSKIQRSILPDENYDQNILSDLAIIWEPRDTVGGDIYWQRDWQQRGKLIILADCTGHGVPGAFMTLIATGALDRAQESVPPGNVGQLIQSMHQLIQKTLGQDRAEGVSDDGLELGACFIPFGSNTMTYAGARFDLYVVDGENIETVKGTKSGIGYRGIASDQTFDNISIELHEDKTFYMATDGIWDQVGGPRNRSFGKKRFRELLASISVSPLKTQKDIILETLQDYQGEQKRRDDLSCVAFKVMKSQDEDSYSI